MMRKCMMKAEQGALFSELLFCRGAVKDALVTGFVRVEALVAIELHRLGLDERQGLQKSENHGIFILS